MCASSMVARYYSQLDYSPSYTAPSPGWGGGAHLVPQIMQDPETKEMLRKAIALLDKIDKRLGDIECFDAEKAAFLKAIEADPTG